ncbi:MAG TPA: FtsX-like permease family protein [Armatimonadota bacterium]|mgnify:CR=1 FL=1|nr:FtsX-like permease family protein [Armatimonadota bacterium]
MVTSKLNIKLLRDIIFSPWLFIGVVIIVAAGIALFQAAYASYLNMGLSYQRSYDELNFADFTIDVRSAPEDVLQRLRRIPGIRTVEGRIIEEIEIELPGREVEKVTGRIVSIPDSHNPQINQLLVSEGSLPRPGVSRALVLESGFAEYHDFKPGDFIYPVIDDEEIRFRVTGIVKSPEYIIVVRGREYPLPSPRQFGVMVMRKTEVDRLFGTSGEINQVLATVEPDANRETVMRLAYQVLESYGAEDPIPREEQASYELLEMDLEALRGLAIFFPLLFLSIASLSIYNFLSRMIHSQRSQIGFMRAIGYSASAVYKHYLSFAVLIGLLGSILGGFLGYYLAGEVTQLYTTNIEVPFYDIGPRWSVIFAGVATALIVTTMAGLIPAIKAAKLPPAQAIRTEVTVGGRVPVLERWFSVLGRLSFIWRLPIRNVFRSPKRSLGAIAGVVSAVVLIFVSGGLLDSSEETIEFYFDNVQKYDVQVGFLNPQQEFVIDRVRNWQGVEKVEPVLQLPAEIEKNGESELTLVYGLVSGTRLLQLQSPDGGTVDIPSEGVLMGEATAERMGVTVGQQIRFSLPEMAVPESVDVPIVPTPFPGAIQVPGSFGYRAAILSPSRSAVEAELDTRVRVVGLTYQPVGNALAMSIHYARRIYGNALELPPNAINGAIIQADPRYVDEIQDKLYNLPGVAQVDVSQYTREEIDELLKAFNTFVYVMLGFSITLSTIIMFNATIMNVIERSREISSLRTLGTPRWMMAAMITIENLIYWFAGMVLGLPLGKYVSAFFVNLYQSESFNMRPAISERTVIWTIVGILLAVLVAQLPAIRYVNRLDLAKSAKEIG